MNQSIVTAAIVLLLCWAGISMTDESIDNSVPSVDTPETTTADTPPETVVETSKFEWIDKEPEAKPSESIRFNDGVVWVNCSDSAKSVVVCNQDGDPMLRIDYNQKTGKPFVWKTF